MISYDVLQYTGLVAVIATSDLQAVLYANTGYTGSDNVENL